MRNKLNQFASALQFYTIKSMIKILKIALAITILISLTPKASFASATTKTQSIINIINQTYSTSNSTASPTDNSLGIIEWQGSKFNNASVYFEAIISCNACNGRNKQVVAELYSTSGSLVSGSAISTQQTTYTKVRSANIIANLSNNTDYTVRLRLDAASGTGYIKHARLIIEQDSTSITDTQNHIDIGNNDTTASSAYELITDPKIYFYDSNNHSDVSGIYLDAALSNSSSTGVTYAALSSSSTCNSTVTGSEVSVTGQSWQQVRSPDISANLTDNTEYWICVKATGSTTGSIARASLVINQSNTSGIADIEYTYPMIDYLSTDSDSIYTSQDGVILYDPTKFNADNISVYSEATLNASAGTAYARLYNTSNSSAITSSEVSTTNTSYTRIRSSDISTNMPSTASHIDFQIKNSGLNTASVSSGWLIIHLHQNSNPTLSFTINSVDANTTSNGITTTVSSSVNTLDFSNITFNTPQYIAHNLTASTNAQSGYVVTMELKSFLQGDYPGNNIDPFPGSWSTPKAWTSPTGTTPNIDTAWIGANTSDTRVSGWSSANQKFGPVNSAQNQVMYSSGADETGTTATVIYVIESNMYQPADYYRGTLVYNITPTY